MFSLTYAMFFFSFAAQHFWNTLHNSQAIIHLFYEKKIMCKNYSFCYILKY